ncbi:hypothetical protein AWM68_20680 [Fictibacillus phosphorivorans]|uniref:Uncharacterized protein n=1 Tax=Fictibacillus phosphorivorans TaxID=1221500 RepID=A0A163QSW0_9BACL|nr:hypothetical protein [Fictibacillus phosphorivorans]KZE65620.1 hypothetical protein AWM68_20680 [Fictibacillus phosphorivorans]
MDLSTFTNLVTTILIGFFKNAIWVVGFFYLLIKAFESEELKAFSKYLIIGVLAIIFFTTIVTSYSGYLSLKDITN